MTCPDCGKPINPNSYAVTLDLTGKQGSVKRCQPCANRRDAELRTAEQAVIAAALAWHKTPGDSQEECDAAADLDDACVELRRVRRAAGITTDGSPR